MSRIFIIPSLKSSGLWLATVVLASSAKMTDLDLLFMVKSKSFMYRRKSIGLSIKPCGTLFLIIPQHEEVQLIKTCWYLEDMTWLTLFHYLLYHEIIILITKYHDLYNQVLFEGHRIYHQLAFYYLQLVVYHLLIYVKLYLLRSFLGSHTVLRI